MKSIVEINSVKEKEAGNKGIPTLEVLMAIFIPLLVVISALLFKVTLNFHMDSDPFWSIGVGEWIHVNRTVPTVDVFSWTVGGEQWQSNSWLFCWLMYIADQYLGYLGVALIVLIPAVVAGYFVYYICKKYHDSNFAIIIFMVGIFALIYISFTPRAYIFTFAFIAVIMYLIRFERNSKLIYLIPLIFLIWVNIQTSMRFGIAILFIEALVGTVLYRDKSLWPVVGLSFIATLINPYGLSLWNISFSEFFIPGTQVLTEWAAPDFNNLDLLGLYSLLFLVALLGASRLKDDFENRIFDRDKIMILFWFCAALLYSLTTVRALHYVLLLLAPCFASFATKTTQESRYLKHIVIIMVIFLFISSLSVSYFLLPHMKESDSGKPVSFVEYLQENPALYSKVYLLIPSGAVAYLKENPILQDHLFNSYELGGYLLLNNISVFIDARESVFTSHSVTNDSLRLRTLEVNPKEIIEKYNINTFLLFKVEPLVFYLDLHPEWEKKHEDEIVVIFTRIKFE